jgi:hypothetical protein
MHDFLVAAAFLMLVFSPCILWIREGSATDEDF